MVLGYYDLKVLELLYSERYEIYPMTSCDRHLGSYIIDIDMFVNSNWVDTRWQYTFTHKQYKEHHN
jgi:hypothetical protein